MLILARYLLGLRRTIPLFKLFPGRPKSTFSSLTAFLGGIFLLFLLANDLVWRRGRGNCDRGRTASRVWKSAGPAANAVWDWKEEKEIRMRDEVANAPVLQSLTVETQYTRSKSELLGLIPSHLKRKDQFI